MFYIENISHTVGRLTIFTILATAASTANGQMAVKTNLLYDASTTPNLGVEIGVGNKNTVQVFYGLNPWTFSSDRHGDRKAKHWVVMPEWRWWSCSRFNGQFFGVHLMGGQFNAGNVDIPLPGFFFSGDNLSKGARNYRYQGGYAGAGFTYGWQWILSRHVNVEAEVGVGYNHAWYSKYPCYECGARIDKSGTNYVGITKLGLSLLYIF